MKEINKKKTIITIGLITVLLCTIGATYAYFTASINKENEENKKVEVTTSALARATMEMGNKIEASGVLPGYKVVKTVRVYGSGPENAKPINAVITLTPNVTDFSNHIEYEVYALDNPNEINANNICSESKKHIDNNQYYDEMTCDTSNLGEKVASGTFEDVEPVGINVEVRSKTDKTYYILVSYVNDEENPQDQEQGKRFTINIDFSTEIKETINLSKVVQLGDYIKMTPTSTSYTIEGSKTGCSEDTTKCNNQSDQTINPSELDLWRVIDIKEDGTIEIVSENVSNEDIYFYGLEGYKKLVGTLNEIAAAYRNDKYTINSRHMGYNGQTEYITNESKFVYPAPWTTDTNNHGNQFESIGGGDNLYQKDVDLVQNTLGTLNAQKQGTASATSYWLASRAYNYAPEGFPELYVPPFYGFCTRYCLNTSNSSEVYGLYGGLIDNNFMSSYAISFAIRPIVVLKSNILDIKGSGTSESSWILN